MSNLAKLYPECCASVNVKKLMFACGYSFALKRKVSSDTIR